METKLISQTVSVCIAVIVLASAIVALTVALVGANAIVAVIDANVLAIAI